MTEITDVSVQPPFEPQYIGDGVYASFDGYQIWLSVGDHKNQVVALEPSVYASLRKYARHFWGKHA